jgi:Glycosyltransferase family 6
MSVLLITIATGELYRKYAIEMVASASAFWPEASTLVFTDFPQQMQAHTRALHTEPKGYPRETLYRYHTFLKAEHVLRQWSHVFYTDADMRFVAPIKNEDVVSNGITATLHPGFAHARVDADTKDYVGTYGEPERANTRSTAYIPENAHNKYFCGGFNGGTVDAYLKMANTVRDNIDTDHANFGSNYMAKWHDESHLNRYLYDNPPARILTPSFCYPEDYAGDWGWEKNLYTPKLLALDKRKRR